MAVSTPKRNFYIFGNTISHSLSPTLHNAGFAHLGLPHHYSIHESPSVDAALGALMAEEAFGGASVTFPHKLQIRALLDGCSESASLVGAVNTVVVKNEGGKRVLWGDNTDWLGIKGCIETAWPEEGGVVAGTGVVVGAGGAGRAAVYAMQMLGVKTIYLVSRTRAKGVEVERAFPGLKFVHAGTMAEVVVVVGQAPRIVVGCVPADDTKVEDVPASWFEGTGVLVEMAYRPLVTALMVVAMERGWKCARGTDVLKEQAYHQFRMWTGKTAPQEVMAGAMEKEVKARG